MVVDELQRLWSEWLKESERAIKALHEETAAIMLRDIERARVARRVVNGRLAELRRLDSAALHYAGRLRDEMGGKFDAEALAKWMDKERAFAFLGLGNQVKATAQTMQKLSQKNRKLFKAELMPRMVSEQAAVRMP